VTFTRVWPSASSTSRRRSWPTEEPAAELHGVFRNEQGRLLRPRLCLELDEPPSSRTNSKAVLVPGHVLALEPKFTFPGEGVVGVEDVFLVTRKRRRELTKSGYGVQI